MSSGIFVGYEIVSGYKFRGRYLVYSLEDIDKTDISKNASWATLRLGAPHIVQVIELFHGELRFPCKARYERLHHSLEGLEDIGRASGDADARVSGTPRAHLRQPRSS